MTTDFIRTLLIMSLTGGGAVLVLFALKPLLKNRLSKTAQYYMWLAPVLILLTLVPVSLPAGLTTREIAGIPSVREVVEAQMVTTNELVERIYAGGVTPSQEAVQYAKQNSPFSILLFVSNFLWPAGAGIFLLWTFIAYLRLAAGLRVGLEPYECIVPRRVRVYTHPAIPTPVLMGLIRPKIILPRRDYEPEELQNILAHELTHYRRRDVALKWLITAVNALHWFNPVVYFMRREINRACELACDEAVIKNLDGAAKQSYGDTLISVVAESRYPAGAVSVTMCEEKKKLKERLVAIMKYKKSTKIAFLAAILLVVLITGGALMLGAQGADLNEADYLTLAEVEKMYGQAYTYVRQYLGEPDGVLSGFWGDVYELAGGGLAIIYYGSDMLVENILINADDTLTIIPESSEQEAADYLANQITPPRDEQPLIIIDRVIDAENIASIQIAPTMTLREAELTREYTSETKIEVVMDYLNNLTLYANLPAVPVPGSRETIAYYIDINYDDGRVGKYVHFGRFFGEVTEDSIDYLDITYEDSFKFEDIIKANPSD